MLSSLARLSVTISAMLVCVDMGAAQGPVPTTSGENAAPFDERAEAALLQRARRFLTATDSDAPDTPTRILTALRDANPSIRVTGIVLVEKASKGGDAQMGREIVKALIKACDDPDWWVRERASDLLTSVVNQTHRPLLPDLLRLLDSPWPEVRGHIVFAVARIPDAGAFQALTAMVNDPDAHVRAHTMKALVRQDPARAEGLIVRTVQARDTHSWVVWYGIEALAEAKAVDALRGLTAGKRERVRCSAVRERLGLGDQSAIPDAKRLLEDPSLPFRQRYLLIQALQKAGYTKELPAIPAAIHRDVETPEPSGTMPEGYKRPHPWTGRLGVVGLGAGRVYLGWPVTRDLKRIYHLERRAGDGPWKTVVKTRLGSHIDSGVPIGKRMAYRVSDPDGRRSPVEHLVPATAAPERPGLARTVSNAKHPITLHLPPALNWGPRRFASVTELAIGDLDNDGRIDYVVGQFATRRKRAYSAAGTLLWERPYSRSSFATHPVKIAIADLDGDGRSEVVSFEEDGDRKWLVVFDGATGRVRHAVDLANLTNNVWERRDKVLLIDRTGGGREDTIVFTHNVYGSVQAVAFDRQLKHLWTYDSPFAKGHKAQVIDLDGDGRDEIILGRDCIDATGKRLWTMPDITGDGHADFIEAMEIDTARPGLEIALAGCGHDITWMCDWKGRLLWLHHTGHSQWLATGYLGADPSTPEIWMFNKQYRDGGKRFSPAGKLLGPTPVRRFVSRIDWDGDPTNGDELLLNNGRVIRPATGKVLFQPSTQGRVRAADVCGDSREEIIVLDPWNRRIDVYTNPTINRSPSPDRWDIGHWRYLSPTRKPFGRMYINPPT